MQVLDKDTINTEIEKKLSVGKRGDTFNNQMQFFDSKELKKLAFIRDINLNVDKNNQGVYHIFDKELYKNRFVIERANAWTDSFYIACTFHHFVSS